MNTISFGEALSHCLHTSSYVIWLIVGIIVFLSAIYLAIKKFEGWSAVISIAIGLVFLMVTFFLRPANVAANTTQQQAARGVYIGY